MTGQAAPSSRPDEGLIDVAVTPLAPERFGKVLAAESPARAAWRFLIPYVERAHAYVFLGPRHLGQYVELLERVLPVRATAQPKEQR